jgi:hypothetical protein
VLACRTSAATSERLSRHRHKRRALLKEEVFMGVRLDADTLCEMLDYLIDNSYVAHTGIVYKQVIGMAMGVHNAPQMANF